MTREERAGLARLMLKWPARREELFRASQTSLLEMFEVYELACDAAIVWSKCSEDIAGEFRQIVVELEHDIAEALGHEADARRSYVAECQAD